MCCTYLPEPLPILPQSFGRYSYFLLDLPITNAHTNGRSWPCVASCAGGDTHTIDPRFSPSPATGRAKL